MAKIPPRAIGLEMTSLKIKETPTKIPMTIPTNGIHFLFVDSRKADSAATESK